MKRLKNALFSDMRFQFKHGFYYVYAAMTLLYIIIFIQIPKEALLYSLPAAIFSDPSLLGFMFMGAIFLLEKRQGIFQYLLITPLKLEEYLFSKIISLSALSLIVSFALAISTGEIFNPFILLLGCLLSSSFFTLIGIYAACGCKSMNQFFGILIPYYIIIIIPAIAMFDIPYTGFFKALPTYTGLKLIFGAYTGISFLEALYCCLNLVVFSIMLFILTIKKIQKKVYLGE